MRSVVDSQPAEAGRLRVSSRKRFQKDLLRRRAKYQRTRRDPSHATVAVNKLSSNEATVIERERNGVVEACSSDGKPTISQLYRYVYKGLVDNGVRELQIKVQREHVTSVNAGVTGRSV